MRDLSFLGSVCAAIVAYRFHARIVVARLVDFKLVGYIECLLSPAPRSALAFLGTTCEPRWSSVLWDPRSRTPPLL